MQEVQRDLAPDDETLPEKSEGRLLWVKPGGEVREIASGTRIAAHVDTLEEAVAACPVCADGRPVETVVREHPACGHVAADGFLQPDGSFECPKCEASAIDPSAFPRVGRAWTCLACGHLSDRSAFLLART